MEILGKECRAEFELSVAQKQALKLHKRITENRFCNKQGHKLGTLCISFCTRTYKEAEIKAFWRTWQVRRDKCPFSLLFLPLGMTDEGRRAFEENEDGRVFHM